MLVFHPGWRLAHVDGKYISFCSSRYSFDECLFPCFCEAQLNVTWLLFFTGDEAAWRFYLPDSGSQLELFSPGWGSDGKEGRFVLPGCEEALLSRAMTFAFVNACRLLLSNQLLRRTLEMFPEEGEEPDPVVSENRAALWSPGYSRCSDGPIWQCGEGVRLTALPVSTPSRCLQSVDAVWCCRPPCPAHSHRVKIF